MVGEPGMRGRDRPWDPWDGREAGGEEKVSYRAQKSINRRRSRLCARTRVKPSLKLLCVFTLVRVFCLCLQKVFFFFN